MSTTLPLLDSEVSSAIRKRLGELCVSKDAKQIKLPLKGVNIECTVADRIAEVKVEQEFHNPYSDPLEAVYIYPLSGGCAVSSFELKVGDQVIVGKVEERQKARQVYQQALADGKRAALLEQERDDVFTVSLGNLPAGDRVCVTIKYSEKLPYYDNGTTELRLPLVVASRYIPGAPLERDQVGSGTQLDTDEVPDASRITPPRLAAGVNPDVDLRICVKLLNQSAIEDLSCSQHATRLNADANSTTVSLGRTDELLDRDFVLRWRVAGEEIKPRLLVYAAKDKEKPSFGMLSLLPPKNMEVAMPGRDIIFLLDRSGSMQGIKMVSAVRACSYLIAALGPKDRFAIQAFDTAFEWMPTNNRSGSDHFVVADEAGIESGAKYLRTIDARGGTELNQAVLLALREMSVRDRTSTRSPVIVVLTDGEVGNESAILKNIQTQLSDNRIFTVGIDTAVNDGFLKRLAALAGGTCTFVQPGTQLEEALNQVGREIGRVLVTDIKLSSAHTRILPDSIAPSRIPDLYDGRATACFFQLDKFKQEKDVTIEISGKLPDGSAYNQSVKACLVEISALPQLWAKAHVVDLEDSYRVVTMGSEQERIKQEIIKLAVEHTLLTKFTAFIAVHQDEAVSDPSRRRTVVQAVHEAQGWEEQPQMAQSRMKSIGSLGASSPQMMYRANAPAPQPAAPGQDDWGGAAPGSGGGAWDMPANESMRRGGSAPRSQAESGSMFQSLKRSPQPPAEKSSGAASGAARGTSKKYQSIAADHLSTSGGGGGSGGGDDATQVRQAYELLDRLIQQTYKDIKANKAVDSDKIDKARTALLDALAACNIAAQLPLLQAFLQAALVQLIAATSGAHKVTPAQLAEMARLNEESWKQVQTEAASVWQPKKKHFWEFSI